MIKAMTRTLLVLGTLSCAANSYAEAWPDLSVGVKNGISAKVGNTLFVGLGSAGTTLLALDLDNVAAGWVEKTPFAGPPPSGAAAAVSGDSIFVFSGSGKAQASDKSPIIFDSVYRYQVKENAWSKVDTATPAGLLGASALSLSSGDIAIVGGYNKALFDKYLLDVMTTDKDKEADKWNKIVSDYMGMEPAAYRWNDEVLTYNPGTNKWGNLGVNPYLPNTGSAVVETADDSFILINGEIKPGLRTPDIKSLTVKSGAALWNDMAPLPAPKGGALQEGLAGAYAGKVGDTLVVAGGANFDGARARSLSGQWYAHEGFPKKWNGQVYAKLEGGWKEVGQLPVASAYGASFTLDEGVLIVGGEDSERKALSTVSLLKIEGDKVSVVE